MAGPKRVPFKNKTYQKRDYRARWLLHFMIGGVMSWPLAMAIGRRAQTYTGGVPIVP